MTLEKPEKITVAEAARLMGKSNLFVYEGLRRGELPIGSASQNEETGRWNYFISPPLLAKYIGSHAPGLEQMEDAPRGDMFTDDQIATVLRLFAAALRSAKEAIR